MFMLYLLMTIDLCIGKSEINDLLTKELQTHKVHKGSSYE